MDQRVDQAVCIFGPGKQDHENQADRQRIGHIRQEVNGLESFLQGFDGAESQGNQQGDAGTDRHRDRHQDQGVFQCLDKERIAEHMSEIAQSDAGIGL